MARAAAPVMRPGAYSCQHGVLCRDGDDQMLPKELSNIATLLGSAVLSLVLGPLV